LGVAFQKRPEHTGKQGAMFLAQIWPGQCSAEVQPGPQ